MLIKKRYLSIIRIFKDVILLFSGALIGFIFTRIGERINKTDQIIKSAYLIKSAIELEKFITENYVKDLEDSKNLPDSARIMPNSFEYGHDPISYNYLNDKIMYLDENIQQQYFSFNLCLRRCAMARNNFYYWLNKMDYKINYIDDARDYYILHLSKLIKVSDTVLFELTNLIRCKE